MTIVYRELLHNDINNDDDEDVVDGTRRLYLQ